MIQVLHLALEDACAAATTQPVWTGTPTPLLQPLSQARQEKLQEAAGLSQHQRELLSRPTPPKPRHQQQRQLGLSQHQLEMQARGGAKYNRKSSGSWG